MNALCKNILKWQKKPSARHEDGVFIVEGIKMFREIPEDRLLYVIVSESFLKGNAEEISTVRKSLNHAGRPKDAFQTVPDEEYQKLSDTRTPQGVMAVLKAFSYTEEEILSKENGLLVILENLQDPGNLGTIFRAGEAAGITGVIMNRDCVDACNPKVIRATMGSFFRVPFCVSDKLEDTVKTIQKKGGAVYAAHLSDSVCYTEPDYRKTTAFMIGNESKGLTKKLADLSDTYIKIPMQGSVESLNAAMASTILLFEAARQRRI